MADTPVAPARFIVVVKDDIHDPSFVVTGNFELNVGATLADLRREVSVRYGYPPDSFVIQPVIPVPVTDETLVEAVAEHGKYRSEPLIWIRAAHPTRPPLFYSYPRFPPEARGIPRFLALCFCDTSLFFSVVSRDVITALSLFLIRRRGRIQKPAALKFTRRMQLDQTLRGGVGSCCFDSNDNIVLPFVSSSEVHVYTALGKFVRKIGTAAQHSAPLACVSDSHDRVFVAEYRANCVQVFLGDGTLERTVGAGEIAGPTAVDLSLDESTLYVVSFIDSVVKLYRTDTGAFLYDIGAGCMNATPIGVAALSSGYVAVCCNSPGIVHIFAQSGAVIRSFGAGALLHPSQIVTDRDDNMYVADTHAHSILVYSSDGCIICRLGGQRGDALSGPYSMAISSAGQLVVLDIFAAPAIFE
jgi:hypothetical protein